MQSWANAKHKFLTGSNFSLTHFLFTYLFIFHTRTRLLSRFVLNRNYYEEGRHFNLSTSLMQYSLFTDSSQDLDYAPDENIQDALLTYLSELTLTDEEPMGLHLPKGDEFHFIHWRRSKRTEYTASTGFSIILSKEHTWSIGNEVIRETVSMHCL